MDFTTKPLMLIPGWLKVGQLILFYNHSSEKRKLEIPTIRRDNTPGSCSVHNRRPVTLFPRDSALDEQLRLGMATTAVKYPITHGCKSGREYVTAIYRMRVLKWYTDLCVVRPSFSDIM